MLSPIFTLFGSEFAGFLTKRNPRCGSRTLMDTPGLSGNSLLPQRIIHDSAPFDRERSTKTIEAIIEHQPSWLVRTYSRIRFLILRQRFLEEIGQYFPTQGRVLDLGCGFGLFSLYYASMFQDLRLVGVDLNPKRIEMAKQCAAKLGLENVNYSAEDALSWVGKEQFDAIYMLDLIHHLPKNEVPNFLKKVHGLLRPGSRFILKEVSNRPEYKRLFTLWLDRAMVGMQESIYYWPPEDMIEMLRNIGFDVKHHTMNDILPYPHVIYICQKVN